MKHIKLLTKNMAIQQTGTQVQTKTSQTVLAVIAVACAVTVMGAFASTSTLRCLGE